jgi:hypothetical protein
LANELCVTASSNRLGSRKWIPIFC